MYNKNQKMIKFHIGDLIKHYPNWDNLEFIFMDNIRLLNIIDNKTMMKNKLIITADNNDNLYMIDPVELENKYWGKSLEDIKDQIDIINQLPTLDLIITSSNINKNLFKLLNDIIDEHTIISKIYTKNDNIAYIEDYTKENRMIITERELIIIDGCQLNVNIFTNEMYNT